MNFETIVMPAVTAVLGFLGGLAAPWMKARFDAQAERREYRKGLISAWRTKLGESAHLPEDFGDSHEYASLRANMLEEVIKRYEAPRTLYVPGGRGKDVRKQMLLDEIARLEREWRLL